MVKTFTMSLYIPDCFSLRLFAANALKTVVPPGLLILPDLLCWWALDRPASQQGSYQKMRKSLPGGLAAFWQGLNYIRTTAHPPPRISGKLNRRWIRERTPSLTLHRE
jgi:hypothetical protein